MSDAFPMPKRPSKVQQVFTSKLNLSALGIFVVFLLCVAYIITQVLSSPLLGSVRNINVQLPQTGGLYVGAPVAYRGVTVGKITDVELSNGGIRATAAMTSGTEIPVDTIAKVRSLSPVGEQYLDFEPNSTGGPVLQNNATVVGNSTDVPRTLASTVISVNKLLDQINPEQLHTILDESSTALAGTSTDLGKLADQGSLLINDLNTYFPQFDAVLHNGGTVADIVSSNSGKILQSANDFRAFAAFLKGYSPELTQLLKNAPATMQQLQGLITDAKATLPQFASVGGQLFNLLASYNPHLRTLLTTFPVGLGDLVGAVRNGALDLGAIAQRDDQCVYSTPQLDPKQTSTRPLQTGGYCPGSLPFLQRGAAHAPGPVPAP